MSRKGICVSTLFVFRIIVILQQSSHSLCLTIDNHLAHPANDCFTRISIGAKFPDTDVALRTDVINLTQCEESCAKYKNGCAAFSFGVGIKGNSTCLISTRITAIENFQINPEYDVYVKKRQDSIWCGYNRIYANPTLQDIYSPVEISKIKENESILSIDNPPSKLKSSTPVWTVRNNKLFSPSAESVDINAIKNGRTTWRSTFAVNCHRKIQPEKKVMEHHIERTVICEDLQDCCHTCYYEKSFICTGFNYRCRPGVSRCTCELSSTPYSRMDIDKDFVVDTDYDYYERNENCPSLSLPHHELTRGRSDIKDYRENAWLNHERTREDDFRELTSRTKFIFTHDHPNDYTQFKGRTNHEESFGSSADHEFTNWIRSPNDFIPRYPSVVHDNIGSDRPLNYHNGYLNVKSSIIPISQLYDHHAIHELSIPNEDTHLYAKNYNYGNAYNYYDAYSPGTKGADYEQHVKERGARRCSSRTLSGVKLGKRVVRKTCFSHDLGQCEEFCINEASFSCESYAYRYNLSLINPADNCLLSGYSYSDLNIYTDVEPDRDYDIYIMKKNVKLCNQRNGRGQYPSEECFSRVRSGFTIPFDTTKKALLASNLGECQFACTSSQEFFCKCFVYKYSSPEYVHSYEAPPTNCFLTDWSSDEINPTNMRDMDGAELYERNTFSYGCDVRSPSLRTPTDFNRDADKISPIQKDDLCYSEQHKTFKLMPHTIISSMRAHTKLECQQRCSTMRNTGTIPCMSFNYAAIGGSAINGIRDNCFLSDISIRDLRPNLDYIDDVDYALYTWTDYDPRCDTINPKSTIGHHKQQIPQGHYSNTHEVLDIGSHTLQSGPLTQWDNKPFPIENDELYTKYSSVSQHGISDSDSSFHEVPGNGYTYSSNQLPPSQRYTVNGYPCKNGTVCQRNKINDFWSCETENEYGSWDYCCEPSHQCGFSRGFHRPWCHVGLNEDQWRPCSETYYPYYSPKEHSPNRQTALYAGRHWPVIYFHEMPPPNCSI